MARNTADAIARAGAIDRLRTRIETARNEIRHALRDVGDDGIGNPLLSTFLNLTLLNLTHAHDRLEDI